MSKKYTIFEAEKNVFSLFFNQTLPKMLESAPAISTRYSASTICKSAGITIQ